MKPTRILAARLAVTLLLTGVVAVVLWESNNRTQEISVGIFSRWALRADLDSNTTSEGSSRGNCDTVDDLNATACCIDVGPPYSASCCAYNPNWCAASEASSAAPSLYCCAANGGGCMQQTEVGDPACDGDNNGFQDSECSGQCGGGPSSSSAAEAYCCNLVTGSCETVPAE